MLLPWEEGPRGEFLGLDVDTETVPGWRIWGPVSAPFCASQLPVHFLSCPGPELTIPRWLVTISFAGSSPNTRSAMAGGNENLL